MIAGRLRDSHGKTTMREPACLLPSRAYNLELLHEERRPGPDSHGWCFGLPPGISPQQWPLDFLTGYPLVHAFTLRLPRDYRCHGPDIAGFSLFACCAEHSDGGTSPDEAILEAMTAAEPPRDARYRPFWEAARSAHPRLHRMSDILGDSFAAILLTEAELNGPLCALPGTRGAQELSCHKPPRWLERGSGGDFFDRNIDAFGVQQKHRVYKALGGVPEARADWSRALRWRARAVDPNAGQAPRDSFAPDGTSAYQKPYYFVGDVARPENFRKAEWTADHAPDHIGGTMQPVQATPKFSPFYVEFEEYLGGQNFGGGNCQFDFLNMQLDWACG
jgi:hypothetical protein